MPLCFGTQLPARKVMAGVYIHIPFCRQACTYCNFHFSTSLRYKEEMIQSLHKELELEKEYLGSEEVETVYIGGGSPSLLTMEDCQVLLEAVHRNYKIVSGPEITLEANPDDISPEKLQGWKSLGINRLSIGIQSFLEEELKWMNRAHTARQALESLQLALATFQNITIDLIYGSPFLTDELWMKNIDIITHLGVPHLSCYALTVEEKTPLHKSIGSGKSPVMDEEQQARQFLMLMQWLKEKGYEHYEVSNFARPGYRSRHNSSYWKGVPYLGIGPSAHSYNGKERRWNIANNSVYVSGIKKKQPSREAEMLSPMNRFNETIMIALRTSDGLDLNRIEKEWDSGRRRELEGQLASYSRDGFVKLQGSVARLTDKGMLRADGIAASLFV